MSTMPRCLDDEWNAPMLLEASVVFVATMPQQSTTSLKPCCIFAGLDFDQSISKKRSCCQKFLHLLTWSFLHAVRLPLLCLNQLSALASTILRFIQHWCDMVDGRQWSFTGSGERAESIMQMMKEQKKKCNMLGMLA
jgi:hypothetical protein